MRDIIQDSDPVLREHSEEVRSVDDLVKEVAGELLYYMEMPHCGGLSAVQLGVKLRIIAVDRNGEHLIIINPVIRKASKQLYKAYEGCLSIDYGVTVYPVERHKLVSVIGRNLDWQPVHYKGTGLFGAILQHEIDHLDGKLICDM